MTEEYIPTTEQVRDFIEAADRVLASPGNSVEAFDRWLARTLSEARAEALREAYAAAERQTQLASLVAGRPTDFEKAVMSCMAAIQALGADREETNDA